MKGDLTTTELKPCPFCGGIEIEIGGKIFFSALCMKCGVEGPSGESESEAAEEWNRRTGSINPDLMSDEDYMQIVREAGATVAAWRCVDRWLVRWRTEHPEDDRMDLDVLLSPDFLDRDEPKEGRS